MSGPGSPGPSGSPGASAASAASAASGASGASGVSFSPGARGGASPVGDGPRRPGGGQGAVVALGSPEQLAGFALAGAALLPARSAAEAVRAWDEGLDDAVLVVLTPEAAAWLGTRTTSADLPLTVVVPG
ncbi:hypothetical protein ACFUC1_13800 [Pedococcus sp. NPDC057267]|uniref:hypothetical protein n=1 Tax=Pedococcus sp. NPDC057267 TaxID=3346077 RepID=UPI0036419947